MPGFGEGRGVFEQRVVEMRRGGSGSRKGGKGEWDFGDRRILFGGGVDVCEVGDVDCDRTWKGES